MSVIENCPESNLFRCVEYIEGSMSFPLHFQNLACGFRESKMGGHKWTPCWDTHFLCRLQKMWILCIWWWEYEKSICQVASLMLQRRKQLKVLLYNHFKEEFFGSHRIQKQKNKNIILKEKDGIIMTDCGHRWNIPIKFLAR
jgi:hypothetical protein